MASEPKKMDRRKFIYAGLGAVALIAIGAVAYVAMNPPLVTQTVTTTVPTTSVVTTTVPTTSVVTTTVPTTSTTSPEELVFWQTKPLTSDGELAWNTLISDFQKAHPEIPLKVQVIPEYDLTTKASATFQLGAVPFDFAWVTTVFTAITWATYGFIDDVSPFFDWMESQYPGDFLPTARFKTPGPKGVKGEWIITSGFAGVEVMHVRGDWIRNAGLDLKDVYGPFDKFENLLYALKNSPALPKGVVPLVYQVGTSSPGDGQRQVFFTTAVFQGEPMVKLDGTINFDRDAFAQTLSTLYKWWKDGILPKSMATLTDFDNNDLFQSERCVMTENGISLWKSISINKPDWVTPPGNKLELTLYPPISPKNNKRVKYVGSRAFVISKNIPQRKKEMIYKFLQFFYTRENYDKFWAKVMGDYMDAPVYKHLLEAPPYTTDYYQKVVREEMEDAFPSPSTSRPSFGALYTDMIAGQAYLKVQTEAMSPEQAADWFAKQLVSYVKKYDFEEIKL